MKYLLIILYLSVLPIGLLSQTKQISGDTIFWHNSIKTYSPRFNTKDLLKSNDDFNFRIHYPGTIIDISKNGDIVSGALINHIYKQEKNGKTIHKKEALSDSIAISLYNLVNQSGILDIESDRMIDKWKHGYDGITYIFEYADKENYTIKKYWTPSSQDSIEEARIVNQFIKNLSVLLNTEERYDKFMYSLPKNGCYSNGGMVTRCYKSNFYWIGYLGSNRLPLGYIIRLDRGYIGNLRTNFAILVNHQFDTHRNYDFSSTIGTYNLLIRNQKDMNDFVTYTYRVRKHDKIENATKFQNHNILYGINFKPISIALGVDFISGKESKIGGSIMINKYFSRPKISLLSKGYIYKNQFDYKIELSKSFNIDFISFLDILEASLYYEKFAKQDQLGWSITTSF